MRYDADVVVAGGGGSGCLAAWRLARQGLRVVLLERGGPAPEALAWSPSGLRDDPSLRLLRGDDQEWPYEASDGDGRYEWLRADGVGGRLNFWNGTSLRMEPDDLVDPRAPELAWPVSYDELEPYYEEMEAELGCCDDDVGFPPDRIVEHVAAAAEACGLAVKPPRASVRPGEDGPQERFRSFSPLERWVPDAMQTGRCTVLPFTVVHKVLVSAGQVRGVEAVSRESGSSFTLHAPVVLLATSTIETARLLLESAGPEHPQGLGNELGLVGKGLMDHVVVWSRAFVSLPESDWNDGRPVPACYIPTWHTGHDSAPPSRFHVQVGVRDVTGSVPLSAGPGRRVVAIVLGGVGEGLAIPGNEVVLDPRGRADPYGNTVPLVRFGWDERHLELGRRMQAALVELLGALSCDVLAVTGGEQGPDAAPTVGGYGHEVGTARMGAEGTDAVVSPQCEVYGVENLFVVDGSVFASYPDKNPTLTILANCARVCDSVAARM